MYQFSTRGAKLHDEGDLTWPSLKLESKCEDEEKERESGIQGCVCPVGWGGRDDYRVKGGSKATETGALHFLWPPLNNVRRPKLLTSLKPTEQSSASLQSGLVTVRGQIAEIIEVHNNTLVYLGMGERVAQVREQDQIKRE